MASKNVKISKIRLSAVPFYKKHAWRNTFDTIYFLSLCLCAVSIPVSNIGMSIAQFGFGVAVFGGLNYTEKLRRIGNNPTALSWIGLFLLFMAGGLHSADTFYFWKDIRIKMPIWVFAAAIGFMPLLSSVKFSTVLHFFLAGVYINMLAGLYLFSGSSDADATHFRELSPFVSHIRMGLFLVTGILIQMYFVMPQAAKLRFFPRYVYVISAAVFFIWLLILKSLTALIILLVISLAAGIWLAGRIRNRKKRLLITGLCWAPVITMSAVTAIHTFSFFNRKMPDFSALPQKTALGHVYESKPDHMFFENGNFVYDRYSTIELENEWRKRSAADYNAGGQLIHYTLLRYMSSKGYSKDSAGFAKMSEQDIRNVEKGIPNYIYANRLSLKGRIYETLWELEVWYHSGDAAGKSMATRFKLWQASWKIIRQNPLAGVGTGDVRSALQEAIYNDPKPIPYDKSYGAHNQWLSTAVALGIPALIWLITAVFLPLGNPRRLIPPAFFFILLTALSMLNEDIFETQASATFIAFFFQLFSRQGMEK